MQPALAEVVQYLTVPSSTATTGERLSLIRSLPWCLSPPRGSPKSSRNETLPTTGKRSGGTELLAAEATGAMNASTARDGARNRIARRRVTATLPNADPRVGRVGAHENCRLRESRAGRRLGPPSRSGDEAARPLGRA